MIAALSPAVSWMLFVFCVGVGALVYIAIAGGRRYRWIEQQFELETQRFDLPEVRLLPHVYDWQAQGDFATGEELARWVWNEDEWKGYP